MEVYDDFTTGEWIEQKIFPMITELSKLKKNSAALKMIKHWPSRPLPILTELREFGVGIPRTEKSGDPVVRYSSDSVGLQAENLNPHVVYKSPDDNPPSVITVRPKRLVQAPDYYRHPQGSLNLDKNKFDSA